MNADSFRCILVTKTGNGQTRSGIERRPLRELPAGDVLIRVKFSSLNYKDALAATGHPGVTKRFPHVPGIDAAGTIAESTSPDFRAGEEVLVTGFDMGAGQWGGWAEYVRVPAEWVVPLPAGLSAETAMQYGTAGLTAALSVRSLLQHGITPESGDEVVTGATGGVGSVAVMLLAKLGFRVTAVSGKADRREWLKSLGAADVIGRQEVDDQSGKPLLSTRWAGAVDTVGGNTLATIIRATNIGGCVTACGLVGGTDLPLTVFPFILRGVTLAGIDSAWCPQATRVEVWSQLAGDWKLERLAQICTTIGLDEVSGHVTRMLKGESTGRVVVRIDDA